MGKLKTTEQIEQERLEFIQRISGNYPLPAGRQALLYVRQSSTKQIFGNIYSGLQQTEDMIDRAVALGWSREQCTIFIENNMTKDGKIRGVSGTIPVEDRPGLKTVIEYIKRGAGAILCVDVSRLTRHADLVDAALLAQTCKRHNAVIVTTEHVYDFHRDGEHELFMAEATEAAKYIKRQVGSKEYPNGKMYRGRTKKAEKGKLVNGNTPVGLMRDETGDNLKPSPHAARVDWLYGRFRALDANLSGLLREVMAMAKRGEPLFPDSEGINPSSIRLTRIAGGWTIASLPGLQRLLTNPAYQGHIVYSGRIIKRDAFPAIVDADNWLYAFNHLADVDLDGNPIEREARAVRYTQRGSTNTALLAGVRENGKPVLDGVNGEHVNINAYSGRYYVRKRSAFSIHGYKASIYAKELDRLVVERVLHWCQLSERACECKTCEQAPHVAMDVVEQQAQPITSVEDDTLEQVRQQLARVERALRTSQDVMDDEELREHFAQKTRLTSRIAKLEQAQKDMDRRAREQEQVQSDIEQAVAKWAGWSLDKRRSFVRLVTDSITLEEIAEGWLRLTIVWSPLMGFISPSTSSTRAVDILYLQRPARNDWTNEEIAVLRANYPTASPDEVVRALPTRSWHSVVSKASRLHVPRTASLPANEGLSIPGNISLTDFLMLKEFSIGPGKHYQWQHRYVHYHVANYESYT